MIEVERIRPARVRVCLVSPLPPPPGGIARWTRMIVDRSRSSDAVSIYVINSALRFRSIHAHGFAARVLAGIPHAICLIASLSITLLWRRPDVVHINTSGSLAAVRDLILIWLTHLFGRKVVYHLRFGRIPQIIEGSGYEAQLMRHALRTADSVICLDRQTLRALEERPEICLSTPHLIPNCVDLSSVPSPPDAQKQPVVLFVGHVTRDKGVHDLLSAWRDLEPAGWRLELVGPIDPGDRDEIDRRVADCEGVRLIGIRSHDEVMAAMCRSEIVVLPSYTEGFPNVVVEAMACRAVVAATPVGAIPEMLSNDCGVIIPVGDSRALATALETLIGSPDRRRRLAHAACAKAHEEYALDAIFHRYLSLWTDVQGQSARGRE